MEEQEYTWAQIAGQVGTVLQQNRALAKLYDMMRQAAGVETYLAEHEATAARMEAALDAQRVQLIETSEAYQELQDVIQVEKQAHAANMQQMRREHSEKMVDYQRIQTGRDREVYDILDNLEQYLDHQKQVLNMDYDVAQAALESLYTQLQAADEQLAALKESL